MLNIPIAARVPQALIELIDTCADCEGKTRSDVIVEALADQFGYKLPARNLKSANQLIAHLEQSIAGNLSVPSPAEVDISTPTYWQPIGVMTTLEISKLPKLQYLTQHKALEKLRNICLWGHNSNADDFKEIGSYRLERADLQFNAKRHKIFRVFQLSRVRS